MKVNLVGHQIKKKYKMLIWWNPNNLHKDLNNNNLINLYQYYGRNKLKVYFSHGIDWNFMKIFQRVQKK
jgi:hypothetical protein